MTDELAYNRSIIGKSYVYYENIFKSGNIDAVISKMKQKHLKYAIDKRLVNSNEIAITHLHIEKNQLYSLQHFISKLKQHEPMGHESQSTIHQNLKNVQEQVQKNIKLTTDQQNCNDKMNCNSNCSLDPDSLQKKIEVCNFSLKKKRRRQKKKLHKNV